MTKTKGSGKPQWAEIDTRIRNRKWWWNEQELTELGSQLSRLPDMAERADIIDIDQPAVGRRASERDGMADGAGAADAAGAAGNGQGAGDDGTV